MDTKYQSILATAFLLLTSGAATCMASTIFVDDGTIYDYTTSGAKSTFSTLGDTLAAIAFNSSGTLYDASRDQNAIYAFSPSGVRSTFATVANPYGLAIDSSGDLFTAIDYGATIVEFTPGGVESTFATGQSVAPGGLAFDSHGDLFAAESQTIYEFAPNGTRTTFATSPGFITGITLDANGDLFADDWNGCCSAGNNATVDEYSPTGVRSVFATLPANQLPSGIAIDPSTGTLYVGEVQNGISNYGQQSVYAITSGGSMSTFATGLYLPWGVAVESSVAPTPEPGTLVLVGCGFLALGVRRRRVRR